MRFDSTLPDHRRARRRVFGVTAAGAIIAAVLLALYDASNLAAAGDSVVWGDLFAGEAIDWILLLSFVPAIIRLTWRMPVAGRGWGGALAVHGAAAVVMALAKMIAFVAIGEICRAAGWAFIDTVAGDPAQNLVATAAVVYVAHVARGQALAATELEPAAEPSLPGNFTVRDSRGYRLVRPDEIIWAEAQGNYARLHTPSGRHLIRSTMASLERTLDPARFVRVHRGTIVSTEHVTRIDRDGSGYTLRLADGTALRGGRAYGDRISRLIG